MDPKRRIIRDGSVAVKDNMIVDVGSRTELEKRYDAEEVIDAEGMAVLPGFVNVHTHLPSIFVRGMYGVVQQGLYQILFPLKEYLKPEHCYELGLVSCLEALGSGSTFIQETYNYMDQFARAVEETGIRADIGEQVAEADYTAIKDGKYVYKPEQAEEMIGRAIRLKQEWDNAVDGRITVSWAPLAPDMCTPWVYEKILENQKPGEKISTHVEQSMREVEQVKKMYGKTSVEHLNDINVLGPDLIGAHCIHNNVKDLRLMKDKGASILHCPRPYLLSGTTAPLARWLKMGVKVGLGTDNVYHTMWETMRAALYMSRLMESRGEPRSPSCYEILELATIKGAEVMGKEETFGSLEINKKADIQLINLNSPHLLPTVDVTSSLVLYASTADVDTVMVDGKIVKKNGVFTNLNAPKIVSTAQNITKEIWNNLFKDRPELKKLIE
jgi:5-methylthioadenosine/S-adenosylhomocysteine deaminase